MNWENGWLLLLSGIVAFLVTYIAIPSVVRVARTKKLFDEPSQRKSHVRQIPTLGGTAIFVGFTLASGSFISYNNVPFMQYCLVACILVFFLGIKDDLTGLSPYKKLFGQIAAALVLCIPGNLRFTNLHGFLGIHDIASPEIQVALTIFVIIVLVNSYNLIDGIDGLAASVGMLTTAFFGSWFFLSGNPQYSLLSAAIFGTLFAFLRYNVFSYKYKIFMGDTGSLLVGLLMSVQVILFNEQNIGFTSAFPIKSAPAVSFAVMIVPLFDTMRVFIIRMLRGRSPFLADKNHIHHLLLKLGYTHVQTTMLIVLTNMCFILLALLLQGIGIFWLMIIVIGIATILSTLLEHLVHSRNLHHIEV